MILSYFCLSLWSITYYFFQVSLLTSATGGQHHPLKYIKITDETTGSAEFSLQIESLSSFMEIPPEN